MLAIVTRSRPHEPPSAANFAAAFEPHERVFLDHHLAGRRNGEGAAGKHDSPNAGWPEAAMAGALALALGGPRNYLGGIAKSHWIGTGDPRATSRDIERALLLYGIAGLLHMAFYATLATMRIQ